MARTALFAAVRRALAEAGPPPGPKALSRRQFLKMTAASAALAGCGTLVEMGGKSVAIVGGGIAGLTIAYRLSQRGHAVTVYEASNRFGGRMFTKRGFNEDGQFCELGGELVDTGHAPLIALAKELGVGIQRLKLENDRSQDIYDIGGAIRWQAQMLRDGRGAFVPLASRIGADQVALTRPDGSWSERASELDKISLRAYLEKSRGRVPDWVIDIVELAYWGEFGLPTSEQSSLNLVDFIGTETSGEFEVFGESDEAFRIAGGSSALPDALLARLGDNVKLRPGTALAGIAKSGSGLSLTLKTPHGTSSAYFSFVALALPFTKLREVEGLDTLGLDPMKLRCIKELGYGDNAKIMIGTKSRPWTDSAAAGLPAPSNGTFYSPEFQVLWDTSRGQAGTRGILTNYLTATQEQTPAIAKAEAGLRKISPAIADSLDTSNIASFFWAKYPFNKGSFTAPRVGQYTTLLEVAGTPELAGRLQFAGEHTSADFPGYMCGGVQSGERAASAILALI